MGGSNAPKPDKNLGRAAIMSAETGRAMLDFMKGQAQITNEWAATDRARQQGVFVPLEDQYIADANAARNPAKIAVNAADRSEQAVADVRQQFALQQGQNTRQLTAMGVNPASGRFGGATRAAGNAEALAAAGAGNLARRQSIMQDEAKADAMQANAINLGKGLAVNPGTSMGLSNSAGQAGFSGAMQGYGQQASILNQDYQNRLQAHNAQNQGMMGLWSGLGSLAGMISSKDAKEDKKPAEGTLDAVRKMPVETWKYKEGIADGGATRHVGPYAEDFHKATGAGDGKTIPFQDALGLTLGAIQELDRKVSKMEKAK